MFHNIFRFGFLFGLGFFFAVFIISVIIFMFLFFFQLLKPRYATIKIWEKYFNKCVANEEFEEAEKIKKLIADKESFELVKVPHNYNIITKASFNIKKGLKIKKSIIKK